MRDIFLGEFFGTMIMILLGCGVCANVGTRKSGMSGGGPVQIVIAWGFAVMLPAYIFGSLTGAHFNPAVTLAMVMQGTVSLDQVSFYLLGEFGGAFFGACLVYLLFQKHIEEMAEEGEKIRGFFCTAPSIPSPFHNLLSEIVGTFVLIFAILGMGRVPQAAASGMDKFLLYGIIVSVGASLGGLTGYAINPARDLGPRLAYAVLPIPRKVKPNFEYGWIPVVGPLIGTVIAVHLYNFIF